MFKSLNQRLVAVMSNHETLQCLERLLDACVFPGIASKKVNYQLNKK